MITSLRGLEGRYIVDTETHVVDVDLDARIAVTTDTELEGIGVHVTPDVFLFNYYECAVGAELAFGVPWLHGTRQSFGRVIGITPVPIVVPSW